VSVVRIGMADWPDQPYRMSKSNIDAATSTLRELLVAGEYRAGDRLPPEREMAERLGLSRPALREVIQRLTEAGLLVSRQGSGTFMAEVDLGAVFAVRLRLEPYAAAEAATHRTKDQADSLTHLAKALGRQLNEPANFADIDLTIHRVIAESCGNPVLSNTLSRLTDLTRLSRAVTSPVYEARKATLSDMRRMTRAIARRDGTSAAAAMDDHLNAIRRIAL
jgi:GntR family transcriptional repressor for pyruvate dehydrogenase complex